MLTYERKFSIVGPSDGLLKVIYGPYWKRHKRRLWNGRNRERYDRTAMHTAYHWKRRHW